MSRYNKDENEMRRTDERTHRHVVGFDWWNFLDPTALTYASYGEAKNLLSPSSNQYFYQPGAGMQSPYWAQRAAAAAANPMTAYQSGRLTAGQQLQQKLRQAQLANIAAGQAQLAALSPSPLSTPQLGTPTFASPFPSTPTDANAPPSPPPFDPLNPYATTTMGENKMGLLDHILGALGNVAFGPRKPPTPTKLSPHSGFQIKTTPKGRQFTSLTVNTKARFAPKKTIRTAKAVAARAQVVAAKALTVAQKQTKVHGLVPKRGKVVPKMGIAAIKALAKKTAAAGVALGQHVNKYAAQVQRFNAAQVTAGKRGAVATHVRGVDVLGFGAFDPAGDHDIVGAEYGFAAFDEIVGAIEREIVGDYIDDNGNLVPGIDPNANQYGNADGSSGGTGTSDGSTAPTDGSTGGSLASQLPGPPDYGAGPVPTMDSLKAGLQPNFDYTPDPGLPDTHFYSYADFQNIIAPVIYDGSQRAAFRTLGTYSAFYGTVPGLAAPKGGPFSGMVIHDESWFIELMGSGGGYSGNRNYQPMADPDQAAVHEASAANWGPFIGAPTPPGDPNTVSWTTGLRFVPDGPQGAFWFWFLDTCMRVNPAAAYSTLQAMLADQITQWKSAQVAGQTDYLNAVTQDNLDAAQADQTARDQAKSDTALAIQQQQADQQDAIFQQQYQQQQSALDLQAQKQQLDYAAAHPELFYDPSQQYAPQYAPQGYGGDGSDLPPELQQEDDGFNSTQLDDSEIDWGDSGNGSDGLS